MALAVKVSFCSALAVSAPDEPADTLLEAWEKSVRLFKIFSCAWDSSGEPANSESLLTLSYCLSARRPRFFSAAAFSRASVLRARLSISVFQFRLNSR
ncbi:hypothetical protein D3C73_1425810 [compost metagenome]